MGKRHDSYIKLYDYGARWYDPQIGRFISPDTIIPDPGNPQSFNRLSYVRNNPLKYTDPTGHAECVDADCKHLAHPITGELMGNKEFGEYLFTDDYYVLGKPKMTDQEQNIAAYAQTIGAGADAAAATMSLIGGGTEIGGLIGGAGPQGFAAGTVFYNLSGLNAASDVFGLVSYVATVISDLYSGNTYPVYDENVGTYALVVGTGTQLSFLEEAAGFASPIATADFLIDSVSLLDSTMSAFQQLGVPESVFQGLGVTTAPNEAIMKTPKVFHLPEILNGPISNLSNRTITTGSSF